MAERRGRIRLSYDPQVDALAIDLGEGVGRIVTEDLGHDHYADFDRRGRLVGIEVLDASRFYDRKHLEGLPGATRWLTLAEASKESGLAADSLRKLCQSRRLDAAVKRGRDWLVPAHTLLTYLENRDTRGRKPKRKPRRQRMAATATPLPQRHPIAAAAREERSRSKDGA